MFNSKSISYDILQMIAETNADAAELVYQAVPELRPVSDEDDTLSIHDALTLDDRKLVRTVSEVLFNDSEALEVIGKNTPKSMPEIKHRALRVKNMDVELVPIDNERTAIVFRNRQ
jgi:hypothetical protein